MLRSQVGGVKIAARFGKGHVGAAFPCLPEPIKSERMNLTMRVVAPSLPVVEDRPRSRWVWTTVALLGIVVFLSRLPLASTALHGSELTSDEADLTLMALDRLFGVPMTNTHWPGVTNQMLLLPVVGVDFLTSGQPRNASGFATFAGQMYRDAWRLVFEHRLMVAALNAIALAGIAWSLRRAGLLRMVAAVLLLQNTHLILFGTQGLGNGPALAARIGLLAIALVSDRGVSRSRAIGLGLLFGVALASRNTSILLFPVVVAILGEHGGWRRWGDWLCAAGATVVGSAPAWVAASLDPIRWLKANLGNFTKVGAPAGLGQALHTVLAAGGWMFWIATIVAAVYLVIRGRSRAVVIGWGIAFAAAVFISARSPLIETRYFDAIVLGAAFVCVLAVRVLLVGEPQSRFKLAGVLLTCAALAVVGWVNAWLIFRGSTQGLYPAHAAVAAQLHSRPGKPPIIVDRELAAALMKRADAESLRRGADQVEAAIRDGEGLRDFLSRFQLEPAVASVFANALNEKERSTIARLRLASAASPDGEPLSFLTCGESTAAKRFGSLNFDQAWDALYAGQTRELVLSNSHVATRPVQSGWIVRPLADGSYVSIRRAD